MRLLHTQNLPSLEGTSVTRADGPKEEDTVMQTISRKEQAMRYLTILAVCFTAIAYTSNPAFAQDAPQADCTVAKITAITATYGGQECRDQVKLKRVGAKYETCCQGAGPVAHTGGGFKGGPKVAPASDCSACENLLATAKRQYDNLVKENRRLQDELDAAKAQLACQESVASNAASAAKDAAEAKRLAQQASFNAWNSLRVGCGIGLLLIILLILVVILVVAAKRAGDDPPKPPTGGDIGTRPTDAATTPKAGPPPVPPKTIGQTNV